MDPGGHASDIAKRRISVSFSEFTVKVGLLVAVVDTEEEARQGLESPPGFCGRVETPGFGRTPNTRHHKTHRPLEHVAYGLKRARRLAA
jgi:hypothetical protein